MSISASISCIISPTLSYIAHYYSIIIIIEFPTTNTSSFQFKQTMTIVSDYLKLMCNVKGVYLHSINNCIPWEYYLLWGLSNTSKSIGWSGAEYRCIWSENVGNCTPRGILLMLFSYSTINWLNIYTIKYLRKAVRIWIICIWQYL